MAGLALGAIGAAYLLSDKGKEDKERIRQALGDLGEKVKNKAGDFADTAMDAVSKGLDTLEDALDRKTSPDDNQEAAV